MQRNGAAPVFGLLFLFLCRCTGAHECPDRMGAIGKGQKRKPHQKFGCMAAIFTFTKSLIESLEKLASMYAGGHLT